MRHDIKKLFRAYQRTGDKALQDKLFQEHQHLVRCIALEYRGRGVDYDDLYQEGALGLLNAIDRYDLSLGYEFGTFAPHHIRGSIRCFFREKSWPCSVPRSVKEYSLRAKRESDKAGRELSEEELSERCGIPRHRAHEVAIATDVWKPVKLLRDDGEIDHVTEGRCFSYEDKDIMAAIDRMTVASVIERALSSDEANIVHLYYYKNLSQREIASQFGTYQMKVYRTLETCRSKMQAALMEDELMAS